MADYCMMKTNQNAQPFGREMTAEEETNKFQDAKFISPFS